MVAKYLIRFPFDSRSTSPRNPIQAILYLRETQIRSEIDRDAKGKNKKKKHTKTDKWRRRESQLIRLDLGTLVLHGASNALEWRSPDVDGRRDAIGRQQIVQSDTVVALWLRSTLRKRENHAQKRLGSAFTSRWLYEHHHTSSTHSS